MSRQDIIITLENCIFGNYKFLYISPERLDTEIFRTKLRKMHISMITVDESHCISQWGYDFRPAYLKIAEIRELLPDVPVLALTATATPEVVKDIQARLHFRHKNVFRMSFERNNLAYIVRKTEELIVAEYTVFKGDDDVLPAHAGVDGKCLDTPLFQILYLVFHQGYQGGNHQAHSFFGKCRDLESNGLAATRRHQSQGILILANAVDDIFLDTPKTVISPILL